MISVIVFALVLKDEYAEKPHPAMAIRTHLRYFHLAEYREAYPTEDDAGGHSQDKLYQTTGTPLVVNCVMSGILSRTALSSQ